MTTPVKWEILLPHKGIYTYLHEITAPAIPLIILFWKNVHVLLFYHFFYPFFGHVFPHFGFPSPLYDSVVVGSVLFLYVLALAFSHPIILITREKDQKIYIAPLSFG